MLYLEEVLRKSYIIPNAVSSRSKNPVVTMGKKTVQTQATSTYTFEQHVIGKPQLIQDLAHSVQEFVMSLDDALEEAPKKLYVAYRTSQSIVCMETFKKQVALYLKLNPQEVPGPNGISRDVSKIGHFGTGDLEVIIKSQADLEATKPFIEMAYRKVGG